jgi:hypothetical protein
VGWYSPEDPTPREQCPCCDYFSLAERRSYLICHVCYWEDDGLDVDKLDVHSGPNHMTLREGRVNFQKFGAAQERLKEYVLSVEERQQYEYRPRNTEE